MINHTFINIESSEDEHEVHPRHSLPESVKARRREIKVEAMKKLRSKQFRNPKFNMKIRITGSGIDEWLNQPHRHYAEKNEMLLNISEIIKKSTYLGVSRYKRRLAHIFETTLCGETTWIVVTEVPGRGATIHSISDNARILTNI